jgi:hypothetical protein
VRRTIYITKLRLNPNEGGDLLSEIGFQEELHLRKAGLARLDVVFKGWAEAQAQFGNGERTGGEG